MATTAPYVANLTVISSNQEMLKLLLTVMVEDLLTQLKALGIERYLRRGGVGEWRGLIATALGWPNSAFVSN